MTPGKSWSIALAVIHSLDLCWAHRVRLLGFLPGGWGLGGWGGAGSFWQCQRSLTAGIKREALGKCCLQRAAGTKAKFTKESITLRWLVQNYHCGSRWENKSSGQARHPMTPRSRICIHFLGNYFPSTSSGPMDTDSSRWPHVSSLSSTWASFPSWSRYLIGKWWNFNGRHWDPRDFQVVARGERSSGVTDTITASIRPKSDCSLLGRIGLCKLIKTGDLVAEIEFLR